MEKFQVPSTSADRSSVSKKSYWKGESVDVSSKWTASLPHEDHTHNNSVAGCLIQGRWDMFEGACTHSPERQEDGTTTNINFNSLTTDGFSLQIIFIGELAHSIVVDVSPTQHNIPITHQNVISNATNSPRTSIVNLLILSGRSSDISIKLNKIDATLSTATGDPASSVDLSTGRGPHNLVFAMQNKCHKFQARGRTMQFSWTDIDVPNGRSNPGQEHENTGDDN